MYEDQLNRMGPAVMLDDGRHMPRPEGCPTPCHQCPKVPRSAPERTRAHAIDPTERSLRALEHYERCKAVGRFPLDVIVERNAGLISAIERDCERSESYDAAGNLALLLIAAGKR